MQNSNKTASYNLRFIVAVFLLLIAVSAFGGGFYGMLGAKGIPVKWLDGSPFSSYFVPALVLVIFVGGPGLIAGVLLLKGHAFSRYAALASAIILLVWIAVQVFIIGYVSWLQPAIAVISLLIIALTLFLFVYEQ